MIISVRKGIDSSLASLSLAPGRWLKETIMRLRISGGGVIDGIPGTRGGHPMGKMCAVIAVALLACWTGGCRAPRNEREKAQRYAERSLRAAEIVREIKYTFPRKSNEDLIEMLQPQANLSGLDAHVAVLLNDALLAELLSRGRDAVPALKKHRDDDRALYCLCTSGPEYPLTIGDACDDILWRLEHDRGASRGVIGPASRADNRGTSMSKPVSTR